MREFTIATAKKIIANEIDARTLLSQYPHLGEEVLSELGELKKHHSGSLIPAIMEKYTASSKLAMQKITGSGYNEKTVNAFLPQIIKARLALYLLEQWNISMAAPKSSGRVRLPRWDAVILQRLLFRQGLERKQVSLKRFKLLWPLITKKRLVMPLLNDQGIYCFYSRELVCGLARLIGDKPCVEIAAGDGTLTRFLSGTGVNIVATDDYSWRQYIEYPDFVEQLDAGAALKKYRPQVVLCSWPAPRNSFEKQVFASDSVSVYIVVGANNPQLTGDFASYEKAGDFTMEADAYLSSLIIPPSKENAVYVFRRK